MQNESVKKNEWGQKCANYLDLPVCPNCGSPNLHELEKRGNVTNCICDRCDSKCWFDDSFSTEGRDTVRFTDNLKIIESTKKSQPATKSFNDMVKEQRSKNHIQKDEGLSSQLEELHRYLDKAWDELADALNLISDSAYPELIRFSNKCDEYCNAIGMMCLDVKELCDEWKRMS